MGIYSPYEVYPSGFDEIDTTECENCTFECGTIGYCIKTCGESYILNAIFTSKGYTQCNLDWGRRSDGKPVNGISLFRREADKFIKNMQELGYLCVKYDHIFQKKYMSTIIIEGYDPSDLFLVFLKLDVIT